MASRPSRHVSPGRTSLLRWLNGFLGSDGVVERVEDLADGVAYCQVFDACICAAGRPGALPLSKVNFRPRPRNEIDAQKNLQLLEDAFRREGIEKVVNVAALARGRLADNLGFLQWMYRFVTAEYPGAGRQQYDAVARRLRSA